MKIKFGIMGCGLASETHAKAIGLIENATLSGACDHVAEKVDEFAKKHDCAAFYSLDDMLDSVDVVCICTPSGLHAPQAIQCANAGRHVIIEKPVALSYESACEVIAACEKNGVLGTVISQMRFSAAAQEVKAAIEEGLLGKTILADLRMKYYRTPEYYSESRWRGTWEMDGGGALINQGIHGVDMLCWLLGTPKEVKAFAGTLTHDIETEDNVSACFLLSGGGLGTLMASTSAVPAQNRRLEIHGERGSIILSEDKIIQWHVDGDERTADEVQRSGAADPGALEIEGHLAQIKSFADAAQNGGTPAVALAEGANCVKFITNIYESAGIWRK